MQNYRAIVQTILSLVVLAQTAPVLADELVPPMEVQTYSARPSPWWDVALGATAIFVGVVASRKATVELAKVSHQTPTGDAYMNSSRIHTTRAVTYLDARRDNAFTSGKFYGYWIDSGFPIDYDSYVFYLNLSNDYNTLANAELAAAYTDGQAAQAAYTTGNKAHEIAERAGTYRGISQMAFVTGAVLLVKGGATMIRASHLSRRLRLETSAFPEPRLTLAYDF